MGFEEGDVYGKGKVDVVLMSVEIGIGGEGVEEVFRW